MDEGRKERQPACKPGSVWPGFCPGVTAIPLGRPSPGASSNQPERQGQRMRPRPRPESRERIAPIRSCSRRGLPCRRRCRPRGALLPHPFTLTHALRPCGWRDGRFAFCGAIPGVAPAGRYPAPHPFGARTFLRLKSGGRPADWRNGHMSAKARRSRRKERSALGLAASGGHAALRSGVRRAFIAASPGVWD